MNNGIKEIITFGKLDDVVKELIRLNVYPIFTFTKMTDIGVLSVCEVSDSDFKVLCDEPENDDTWQECGWRSADGANTTPTLKTTINNNELIGYMYEDDDKELEAEENDCPVDENLLDHFSRTLGVGQPRNVTTLAIEMAKVNNMKLSKLLKLTL